MALVATGVWYQDHVRQLDKADGDKLASRLSEGTSKLLKGQDELAKDRPDEARLTLSNLITEIKDEPRRLSDLHRRATALLNEADDAIGRAKADEREGPPRSKCGSGIDGTAPRRTAPSTTRRSSPASTPRPAGMQPAPRLMPLWLSSARQGLTMVGRWTPPWVTV